MPRYIAFLRGVSPLNASMPELRKGLLAAGFKDVVTVLSSGNVVFSTRASALPALEKKVEKAIQESLGRPFAAIVRPADYIQALVAGDPFAGFELSPKAKRVVTFLRHAPDSGVMLPIERDGARILKVAAAEAFTAYEPSQKGPVFMAMLERAFGKDITTRSLDTVNKCAWA